MKHCNSCDTTKEDAEFHKRKASIDGLSAKCRHCQSDYDKARANQPNRIKARREYARTQAGKNAHERAQKKWLSNNTLKRKAHVIVGNAIRDGRLLKEVCEDCGNTKVHAHHDDYSKPLDVRWLCDIHHNEWHKLHGEATNG